jgi:hypothetical protein
MEWRFALLIPRQKYNIRFLIRNFRANEVYVKCRKKFLKMGSVLLVKVELLFHKK